MTINDEVRLALADLEQGHVVLATSLILRLAATQDQPRIGTHDPNCWRYGYRHYECALAEIARLQALLETQP